MISQPPAHIEDLLGGTLTLEKPKAEQQDTLSAAELAACALPLH